MRRPRHRRGRSRRAAKTSAGPRSSPAGGGALERDQLLRFGSRGEAVAEVQRALGIPADGVFGPQTRKAVRALQAQHGLVVDGIVGPQTLAALGLPGNGPSETAPEPQAVPVSSSVSVGAQAVVAEARRHLGKPYVWGGSGPGSFDCSGLTAWTFRAAGVTLPHQSQAQFGLGRAVSRANVRAGDLVFFATNGPGASHVGIADDGGFFISATSQGVRIQPIGGSYCGAAYVGARRVI